MRKLLYISSSVIPSDKANSVHVMKMCEGFSENGCAVTLLCPVYNSSIDVFDYYSIKHPFSIEGLFKRDMRFKLVPYLLFIVACLKKHKESVVYGRFLLGCYISSLLGRVVMLELHSPPVDISKFSDIIFRALIKRENLIKVVVISNVLKKIILANYRVSEEKLLVLHDAADIKQLVNLNQKKRSNVAYVGSLNVGKGWEIVMELAKRLPSFQFYIVGGNDKQIQTLRPLASNNLEFVGFKPQKHLQFLYRDFDIMLLPNQQSVFTKNSKSVDIGSYTSPLKLFEYMSYGKPIISSNIEVLREVLDENTALLVRHDKIDEWESALLLLEDLSLRQRISSNALAKFLIDYTWSKRAKSILLNYGE